MNITEGMKTAGDRLLRLEDAIDAAERCHDNVTSAFTLGAAPVTSLLGAAQAQLKELRLVIINQTAMANVIAGVKPTLTEAPAVYQCELLLVRLAINSTDAGMKRRRIKDAQATEIAAKQSGVNREFVITPEMKALGLELLLIEDAIYRAEIEASKASV